MRTLKWFKNRIGKRIYRNRHKCCKDCEEVAQNGLEVRDEMHANYLYETQNDFARDGIKLDYRDDLTHL